MTQRHIRVKIYGSICKSCDRLERNVLNVVNKMNFPAEVEKITKIEEMVSANITRIPALVIDGKLYSQGRVVKEKELIKLFSNKLEERKNGAEG